MDPQPPSTLVMPSSTNHETTVNIIFGIAAVLFSLLTLWQAHRLWGIFRRHGHGHHAPRSSDDGTHIPMKRKHIRSINGRTDFVLLF